MLTADVRVEEFDASDWIALRDILAARHDGHPEPVSEAGGTVVVLVEGARAMKVFSTAQGRLDPAGIAPDTALSELAERFRARWVVRMDRRALPILSDRFARRLERSDDLIRQTLKFGASVRELADEGLLETYPRDARALLLPTELVLDHMFDTLCPVGKTILLAAFDGSDVVTSIALHRGEHGFDRIVGPAVARTEMGLLSGDWTRDCRGLSRAFELGVGPLSFGCFAQATTWTRLMSDRSPGAWAAAVAAREVVFHPVSPLLAIPIGLDVGRVALVAARDLAVRFGLSSWFARGSALRPALERVRDAVSGGDLERIFGSALEPLLRLRDLFDPEPRARDDDPDDRDPGQE